MNHLLANLVDFAVDEALVLRLHDDGAVWQGNSSATIYYVGSRIDITIDRPLAAPLMVHNHTAHQVTITVARHMTAHVIFFSGASSALELRLSAFAHGHCYLVPQSQDEALKLSAAISDNAHLRLFELGCAQRDCERDMAIDLVGERAEFSYCSIDLLCGKEKKRSSLIIKHGAPHTTSAQTFRGIYGGHSQASFLGQVIIDKNAPQSSAKQLYKSTLVSEHAKAHVMPQLVIYNKDISATHGASIGEPDREALFYLRSRGLSMAEALGLIVASAIEDVLDQIELPAIRKAMAGQTARATSHLLGVSS